MCLMIKVNTNRSAFCFLSHLYIKLRRSGFDSTCRQNIFFNILSSSITYTYNAVISAFFARTTCTLHQCPKSHIDTPIPNDTPIQTKRHCSFHLFHNKINIFFLYVYAVFFLSMETDLLKCRLSDCDLLNGQRISKKKTTYVTIKRSLCDVCFTVVLTI